MKVLLYAVMFCLAVFVSCSRRTAETVYVEGKQAETAKNFNHAAELYESIVSDFPASALAESSLVRLSILYNSELKDPRKTLSAYQRCYSMFPGSKQAPTMLFLTAFVFNNELHQTDSARAVYEQFLTKYPKHELAQSAEFELKTLGKDPGEILTQGKSQQDTKSHQ